MSQLQPGTQGVVLLAVGAAAAKKPPRRAAAMASALGKRPPVAAPQLPQRDDGKRQTKANSRFAEDTPSASAATAPLTADEVRVMPGYAQKCFSHLLLFGLDYCALGFWVL